VDAHTVYENSWPAHETSKLLQGEVAGYFERQVARCCRNFWARGAGQSVALAAVFLVSQAFCWLYSCGVFVSVSPPLESSAMDSQSLSLRNLTTLADSTDCHMG